MKILENIWRIVQRFKDNLTPLNVDVEQEQAQEISEPRVSKEILEEWMGPTESKKTSFFEWLKNKGQDIFGNIKNRFQSFGQRMDESSKQTQWKIWDFFESINKWLLKPLEARWDIKVFEQDAAIQIWNLYEDEIKNLWWKEAWGLKRLLSSTKNAAEAASMKDKFKEERWYDFNPNEASKEDWEIYKGLRGDWEQLYDKVDPNLLRNIKASKDLLWWYTENTVWDYMTLRDKARYAAYELSELNEAMKTWQYDNEKIKQRVDEIKTNLWEAFEREFEWQDIFPDDYDYKKNYHKIFDLVNIVDDFDISLDNRKQYKPFQDLVSEIEEYQELQKEDQLEINETEYSKISNEKIWLATEYFWDVVKNRFKETVDNDLKYEWRNFTERWLQNTAYVLNNVLSKEKARYDSVMNDFENDIANAEWTAVEDTVINIRNEAQEILQEWLDAQIKYYKFFIDNIGKPWFESEEEIRKQYIELTWDDAVDDMDMYMYNNNVTIRDKIKSLKNKATTVSLWFDLATFRPERELFFGDDYSWTDYIKDRATTVWKFGINLLDTVAHETLGKWFRWLINWYTRDSYRRSWRRTYKSDIENISDPTARLDKSVAVVRDQAGYVIPGIIEFVIWNKLTAVKWLKWISKARYLSQYSDDVVKWYNTIASTMIKWSADDFAQWVKLAKEAMKTKEFAKASRRAFWMKMFEQSFLMPVYFEWWRIDDYKDEDMVLDIIFWWTIDLMDAYKTVRNATRFSNAQTVNLLLDSNEFVDKMARNMFNKNLDVWSDYKSWDSLTTSQKNKLRSEAKWYMDRMTEALYTVKEKVWTTNYNKIRKMMETITEDNPDLLIAMERRWESLYKLTYDKINRQKKQLAQLKFQETISQEYKKAEAERKWYVLWDDWEWIYKRQNDSFYINRPKTEEWRMQNYYLNNILSQQADKNMVKTIKRINVWDKSYKVEFVWDRWDATKNTPTDAIAVNLTDSNWEVISAFIYKVKWQWNVNLWFSNKEGLAKFLWEEDVFIDEWARLAFDKQFSVVLKWESNEAKKTILNVINYEPKIDFIKNIWDSSVKEYRDSVVKAWEKLRRLFGRNKNYSNVSKIVKRIEDLSDEVLKVENRLFSNSEVNIKLNKDLSVLNKDYAIIWSDSYKIEWSWFWMKEFDKPEIVRDYGTLKIWDMEFNVRADKNWNIILKMDANNLRKLPWDQVDKLSDGIRFSDTKNIKESDPGFLFDIELNPKIKVWMSTKDHAMNIFEYNDLKNKLTQLRDSLKGFDLDVPNKDYDKILSDLNDWINNLLKRYDDVTKNFDTDSIWMIKAREVFHGKLEKYFSALWISKNVISEDQMFKISKEIFLNNDNPDVLYNTIKNLDGVNSRLKNFLTDVMDPMNYWVRQTKSNLAVTKKYERSIKDLFEKIKNNKRYSEYNNIFWNMDIDEFRKSLEIYIDWAWSTGKWLKDSLYKKWINFKDVSDKVLQTAFESISNIPIRGWSIKKYYKENLLKLVQNKTIPSMFNKTNLKTLFDDINSIIKNFEADQNFMNKRKVFLNKKTNEEKALFLNNPANGEFRKQYADYMRALDDANFMIDNSYWYLKYSDFMKERKAGKEGIASYAMRRKLNSIWNKLEFDAEFWDKNTYEKFMDVLWRIYNVSQDIWEKELVDLKMIMNDMWDILPPDARKTIKDISKWIGNKKTIDEVAQDNIMKDIKTRDISVEDEIKELENMIETNKKTVGVIDGQIADQTKYLWWYSTKLWKMLFPQTKDYIWDEYFRHSDIFRNILNSNMRLSDWSSLKDMLFKWNIVEKEVLRSLKKSDQFINDLFDYATKWKIDNVVAEQSYLDLLKSAKQNIDNIYDSIIKELGDIYWKEFVESVKWMKKKYSKTNISRIADLLEHWDFMEFIRYADFNLFERLSIDHQLANKLWWTPVADYKKIPGIGWVWSDNYNRKRIYAMNSLAHNNITSNQAKTMWWFMNNIVQPYNNSSVKKWLSSLKNNNIVKYWDIALKMPWYVLSQTVIKPAQATMLLLLNAQATAVDFMVDSRRHRTTNELYDIRKKYNILVDPWEMSQASWWPLRKLLNWEINSAKEFLREAGKRVSDIAVQSWKLWVYNAWEITFDPAFRNSSLRKALLDETWTITYKEFDEYISRLWKEEQDALLQRIRRRAEDQYILRTANSINVIEWKFLYWDPYSLGWNIKKTLWRAYHFLSARWNQHVKNYFRLLKNWSRSLEKTYSSLMAQVWKYDADILIKDFINKNNDINVFMSKLVAAVSIGDKMNRNDEKTSNDPRYGRDRWDITWIGMSFFAPAQWWMSSWIWRQISNTIKWVLMDMWYEWVDVNNWLNAFVTFIETMMSNMWRRMLLSNSFMWAVWQRDIKKEMGTLPSDQNEINTLLAKAIANWRDFMKDFMWNFDDYTNWYTYFLSDDIINRWYKTKLPTSSVSDLDLISPDYAFFKKEYWEMSTLDRVKSLEKDIEDSWYDAVWNWMTYKWPIVKWRKIWQIDGWSTDLEIVLNDWISTKEAYQMYSWEQPDSMVGNREYNDMMFQNLIRWWVLDNYKPVQLEDWTLASKRAKDMKKEYFSKKGNIKREQQNQEDIFFRYMRENLEEGDRKTYVSEFNRTDSDWVKAWLRFLWAIESSLENDVPWSSYTLVAALAQDTFRWSYNELRNAAWYKYWEEPEHVKEELSAVAKDQVVKAFGDTLYVTNKPYRSDAAKYVASKVLPQHAKKFTWWEIDQSSVDDQWENIYRQKTYFWTKLAYESLWWKDSVSTWLWNMDMYNIAAINEWKWDIPELSNWMYNILLPKNETHAKDPKIQQHKIALAMHVADMWNDSSVPEQAKLNARVAIWMTLEPILSAVIKNEEIYNSIPKEEIDEAVNFLFWTVNEIWEFEKDQLDAMWINEVFKQLKKEDYEWPKDKPTWTLLDLYEKDWNYYYTSNSYWSSWSYKYNKPYRDNFRSTVYNWWYTKTGNRSWSSGDYYNKNLSSYFYYRYYFKNAESKWFGVWDGREKIWRMFKTIQTKLRVPKTK